MIRLAGNLGTRDRASLELPFLGKAPSRAPMRVLVISGFLGAGKTTLLKRMLGTAPSKVCVLENEFGPAGVDGAVLRDAVDVEIVELSSGCICCTTKGSFESSVLTIMHSLAPEILVVESTGVAKLSNVMQSLHGLAHGGIEIMRPITVVDSRMYDFNKSSSKQLFEDQIAWAGTVYLSKTEGADDEVLKGITGDIATLNPGVEIIPDTVVGATHSLWSPRLPSAQCVAVEEPSSNPEQGWETVSFCIDTPVEISRLIMTLSGLANGGYGYIPRAKGFVESRGAWLRFDLVGDRFCIEQFSEQQHGELVLIGRNLQREVLFSLLTSQLSVG